MSLCKVLQFVVVQAKANERKISGSEVDLVIKIVQFLVDGFWV